MKTQSSRALLIAVCSALAAAALPVVAQDTRSYMHGDVGGQVTQDTKLIEFFGESLAPNTKIKFDPGFRMGFAGGFHITDWFSAEIESALMVNNISSITGANSVEATFSNIPFLFNARFDCPNKRWVVAPYLGGGLGFSTSIVDADHIFIGSTVMSGTEYATVFAYQAFGGIRFRLNDRTSINLEYHYFATDDAEWEVGSASGTATDRMKFGGTQTHALSIAFDLRF